MEFAVPKIRSVRDQVYDGIKSMIVSGQIPQGTKLQESELAELFQVSRTPVREALKILKDDGLLESGSGKGLFVKVLTPGNVEDIFQVRSLLEQFAIRYLVTKDGGDVGGFAEKAAASAALGVTLVVIRRPEESGETMEEILRLCEEMMACR